MQAVLGLFTDYGSVYVHHTLLEMRLSLAILLLATLFVALVDCRKVYGRRDKRKHNEVDDLGAGWTYLRKVRKQCSHILNDSPIREIQEPDGSRCKVINHACNLVGFPDVLCARSCGRNRLAAAMNARDESRKSRTAMNATV
ncbi:uncharacterized protein LOC144121539 isoform X2 [Amblyomma americanum]